MRIKIIHASFGLSLGEEVDAEMTQDTYEITKGSFVTKIPHSEAEEVK